MNTPNSTTPSAGCMQMQEVGKSFAGKTVLQGVSLNVDSHAFTCVCGPSGCGKTTIMGILAGYIIPDSGTCTFNGQPLNGPSPDRLAVFQENTLFQWMNLWDNVLFGPKIQGANLQQAAEKAHELIELTGLSGFEKKFPNQLSGGMQRRAELIRALINEPQILLMDEPFRGLDAMTRSMMQEYFLNVFESTQITMLLITSELDEAVFMGDKVYLLSTMPTAVKEAMPVPLSRPRTITQQASVDFAEIQTAAFSVMEAEALKSFEYIPHA